MANFSQNIGSMGLGSLTFVAPAAGVYHFIGSTSLPMLSEDVSQPAPPSSVAAVGSAPDYQAVVSRVITTITQAGPTVYTGVAGATGFQASFTAALGDTFVLTNSSANPADQPPNAVKTGVVVWS